MRRVLIGALLPLAALLVLAVPAAIAVLEGSHEGHTFNGVVTGGLSSDLAPQQNAEYVTGDTGFTGGHVAVQGDRLYLGSYGRGVRAYDISTPGQPRFLSEYLPGGVVADAPPDAANWDGREIVVLNGTNRTSRSVPQTAGRTDHTYFLDWTDPASPRLLWKVDGLATPTDGESHNGDIVDARRLYLPSGLGPLSGTQNGLRIYDLNPLLESPARAPQILFRGDPVKLWEESPYRRGRPIGPAYTHTHDIEVYVDYPVAGLGPRDIALIAEGGNYTGNGNTGSMLVVDITDPSAPVALFRWLHETGPTHHPIRYHHEVQLLEGDPHVALVTDEDLHNGCNAGGVTALRMSDDLTSATELSEWFIGAGTPAPVCSVHVFSSEGNLVYFGSYNAGLQVVDYSDPTAPKKVAYHIAPGTTAWGALVHEGFVYVGDMARGLDVFRYTGPKPDLAVTPEDVTLTTQKDRATITATVRNIGGVGAAGFLVRFADNGALIGERSVAALGAGDTATVSVPWSTRGLKGERTITVSVDPANAVAEADETNNEASRTAVVQGNKVRNGSFEQSSNGTSPDGWQSSGQTSYASGGSDGARSASAGPGGTWTSDPIAVTPGTSYAVAVDVGGSGGTLLVQQLSATGLSLGSSAIALPAATGPLATATGALTALPGVAQVRLTLVGGPGGATTFDDVWLSEQP
jgi:hypothetical protein